MAPQIRLAVLLCDTPVAPVLAEEGNYHKIFTALMRDAKPGADFVMDAYNVKDKLEYPTQDLHYDGIFLTGSGIQAQSPASAANLTDTKQHLLHMKILNGSTSSLLTRPRSPQRNLMLNCLVRAGPSKHHTFHQFHILGICFGHQIIGRALGGECVPNGGIWEVGITEVALNELGQKIFGLPTLVMKKLLRTMFADDFLQNIQQMHQDHVPCVPGDLKLLGSTSVSMNQGMVRFKPGHSGKLESLTDIQIITVQGHPEFTKDIVRKVIDVRADSGIITRELADDAKRRNVWRNDGVHVIADVFWKILGVE